MRMHNFRILRFITHADKFNRLDLHDDYILSAFRVELNRHNNPLECFILQKKNDNWVVMYLKYMSVLNLNMRVILGMISSGM